MDFRTIKEEYNSIYSSKPEYLAEDTEELVEILDEEYEAIVEEIASDVEIIEELVYEMLEEGFDAEEIEGIFDEIFEAQVTTGQGSRMAAASRLARMQAAKKITKQKERKEKVKAAVSSAKGAVKGALDKAAGKARDAKAAAKGAVKDAKRSSHVGLAKYASKRNLMPGPGLKTQSSKGRGELLRQLLRMLPIEQYQKQEEEKKKQLLRQHLQQSQDMQQHVLPSKQHLMLRTEQSNLLRTKQQLLSVVLLIVSLPLRIKSRQQRQVLRAALVRQHVGLLIEWVKRPIMIWFSSTSTWRVM